MMNRSWFKLGVLALSMLAMVAWGVVTATAPARNGIQVIRMSRDEQTLASALDAQVTLKFRVGRRLPAGTVVTHWVEHYQGSERTDLAKRSVTLEEDTSGLVIMLTMRPINGQEEWNVHIGPFGQRGYAQWLGPTCMGIYTKNRRFAANQPILLAFGVFGLETTTPPQDPGFDAFAAESVEPWLHNDQTFAFKVSFELPNG